MFRIALDAGHGMYTAGKRCLKAIDPNETREWWLNNRICKKIQQNLTAYEGYEILRVDDPTGKTDVPLITRTRKANEWGADFYLSIHANAHDPKSIGPNGGKGGGIVTIIYTKASQKSKDYQKLIYNELIKETGLKGNRSDPMTAMNLHVCRETKMPCVLCELGFMDSISDTKIILTEDFADDCAEALTNALVEIGGLKEKETLKPIESEYRKKVIEACGFSADTAAYLDGYKYATDLYKALWECLREGKERSRG